MTKPKAYQIEVVFKITELGSDGWATDASKRPVEVTFKEQIPEGKYPFLYLKERIVEEVKRAEGHHASKLEYKTDADDGFGGF